MTDPADLLKGAPHARREDWLDDAPPDPEETRELVRTFKKIGQGFRDMGNADAARSLYKEAVGLCRELDDPLLLAHTVRHLGDVHRETGRADLAERCYREALTLYRGHDQTPTLDLANAVRPLAILLEETDRTEEARRLWQEARDLYKAVEVREGVDECAAALARLAQEGSGTLLWIKKRSSER